MKRVIIFWDHSNFQITLDGLMKRELGGRKSFDYAEFAKALQGGNDLIKIYFACSAEELDITMQGFYDSVDTKPFFYVKQFERSMRGAEKQVDVYLATQMVALAYENAYDIAYLVSGDEDYLPAIEIVQQKGKIVAAVSANESISSRLKRRADQYILIDDNASERMKPYLWRNFVK